MERAVVLCDGYFGDITGKTANGLVRYSKRYEIAAVIDRTKAGQDAGEVLDGKRRGIPILRDLREAVEKTHPDTLILGVATEGGYIPPEFRPVIREAIEGGLNVASGLHEYLGDDPEFAPLAAKHGVTLIDVRRPRAMKDSHHFANATRHLPCLRIPVLGTDGVVGKRTCALLLTDALKAAGVRTTFVATGQTGLLQGSPYGVPLDSLTTDFMVGELESEIVRAFEETKPQVIVVEGQGSITHPAYVCGSRSIVMASMPSAILMMHPPARKVRDYLSDTVAWPMPTPEQEIEALEFAARIAGGGKVFGIGINHEHMTRAQVDETVAEYERRYGLPTADPLWHGCGKFVEAIRSMV